MTDTKELPFYEQMNPHGFFADDDTLYPEGSKFYWSGIPNDYMRPLNGAAVEALEKYNAELDEQHRKYCEKTGRPFTPRPTDWREAAGLRREDETARLEAQSAKKTKVTPVKSGKPNIQGHINSEGQIVKRGRGRPPKIQGAIMPTPPKVGEKPPAILGKGFEDTLSVRG